MKEKNSIQLIRHATLVLYLGGKRILIDPMLSSKEEMDPVKNCGNERRIPMVDLPFNRSTLAKLLERMDAVVITHTHRDHWDTEAQQLIPKSKQIFCQPADLEKIKQQGFENVLAIENHLEWSGLQIHRTGGQHGTGEIGKQMGVVSGFVFIASQTKIYVAGDTIWCREVEDAIDQHKPKYIVVNAGAAQFLTGDPITMTPQDVIKVVEKSKSANVIAVHMDTVNHCFATRAILKTALQEQNIRVSIPVDGEVIVV